MSIDYLKKAKQCCTREHDRLLEQLDICDSRSKTPAKRHGCYRIAARRSGRRSIKCTIGGKARATPLNSFGDIRLAHSLDIFGEDARRLPIYPKSRWPIESAAMVERKICIS